MEKNWFKSKTFWGSALGILGIMGAVLRGDMSLVAAFPLVMAFVTAFGIRDSI